MIDWVWLWSIDPETGDEMNLPQFLELANNNVVMDGVNPNLVTFLGQLAVVHKVLFNLPLIVTSGKDSLHAAGSLHGAGLAVDVRTHDKDAAANQLLLCVLAFAADGPPIAVFDERALPGSPHIHIEWHGA